MSKLSGQLGGRGRRVTALLAAGMLLVAAPADATIISGSVTAGGGSFIKLAIPLTGSTPANTVGNDNFNLQNLYGFDESQNTTLTSNLTPDFVPGGGLVTLLNGTTVASHYVFYDPTSGNIKGMVNFDADILAVLTRTITLAATDYLANTGVNYLNPSLRGLEPGDLVTISGARQISIDFTASSPGDYVRVLTAFSPGALPEPSSYALIGVALLGMGVARRRRQR